MPPAYDSALSWKLFWMLLRSGSFIDINALNWPLRWLSKTTSYPLVEGKVLAAAENSCSDLSKGKSFMSPDFGCARSSSIDRRQQLVERAFQYCNGT
jgi:hypothetical protein